MSKTEPNGQAGTIPADHTIEDTDMAEQARQAMQAGQADAVHFGTDGWRAIIDADFNPRSVARVADAAARVFAGQLGAGAGGAAAGGGKQPDAGVVSDAAAGGSGVCDAAAGGGGLKDGLSTTRPAILVGYDCRRDAGRYAALAATVLAARGFKAVISDRYCPTPALCWTIANNPAIVGGLMLTSSHNPADYLGIKLRMSDGGASPQDFTDLVEQALDDDLPECFDAAMANFAAAGNGTPEAPIAKWPGLSEFPGIQIRDIMSDYLNQLLSMIDADAIKRASLRVVIDPMFGAGRGYLAGLLRQLEAEVVEVNAANDPSFNGLHPEPILPWISVGAEKVAELGYDACFVTDGDADRIGAVDDSGTYVSAHRLLALLIAHLVEDKGQTGRVVRTRAGSNLLRRQCQRLGLELCSKPIGFKWIYQEMLHGDVLIGGEESGGIGIPGHVKERDGLLMALLLTELMAEKGRSLRQLVADMLEELGALEYARRDLQLTDGQKQALLNAHVQKSKLDIASYQTLFTALGEILVAVNGGDGIKFDFSSDAWLLVRPSGTEPLVRIYAEAATDQQVQALLDIGCALAQGD